GPEDQRRWLGAVRQPDAPWTGRARTGVRGRLTESGWARVPTRDRRVLRGRRRRSDAGRDRSRDRGCEFRLADRAWPGRLAPRIQRPSVELGHCELRGGGRSIPVRRRLGRMGRLARRCYVERAGRPALLGRGGAGARPRRALRSEVRSAAERDERPGRRPHPHDEQRQWRPDHSGGARALTPHVNRWVSYHAVHWVRSPPEVWGSAVAGQRASRPKTVEPRSYPQRRDEANTGRSVCAGTGGGARAERGGAWVWTRLLAIPRRNQERRTDHRSASAAGKYSSG